MLNKMVPVKENVLKIVAMLDLNLKFFILINPKIKNSNSPGIIPPPPSLATFPYDAL